MDPLIVLFGAGVGLLVGMTGVGGGSIMTPLLILAFGTTPVVAVGTDLAYAAVTKTLGGWRHLRAGTVDTRLALWMATGSIPGALGGVAVLERLRHASGVDFDTLVLVLVGVAVLVTGLATVGRAVLVRDAAERERDAVPMARRHKVAAAALGLGVGVVLGLTSAGSGALIAVGLILGFRLTPRRVVGTDIFHAALLLWVAALAHLVSGNLDVVLMLNLLIGSLPGVYAGSGLGSRAPAKVLRPLMGTVLCVAGTLLCIKAGAPAGIAVAIGIAAALGGVAWLVGRAPRRVRGAT